MRTLRWLCAVVAMVASVAIAHPAFAQVRIDRPTPGTDVKTPFVVTGTAPPGAQLELWVGTTLERKFIADSSGHFSAAVSHKLAAKTTLWVYQVDASGTRVGTASVDVNWAGEAPARAVQGEPASTASDTTPRTAASTPRGAVPEAPDDLDVGAMQHAPAPPPVDQSENPFGPQPEKKKPRPPAPTTSSSPSTATHTVRSSPYPAHPTHPRSSRISAEAGAGLGAGLAGGFAGLFIGAASASSASDPIAALAYAVLGGAAGYVVGVPIGVGVAGYLMDGNGKAWALVLGDLLGSLAGLGLTAAYLNVAENGVLPAILLLGMPITGSIIGFELTSDPSRWAAKHRQRAHWAPVIAPSADGHGFAAGLGLTF